MAAWAATVFWRVRLPLGPLVGLLAAMAATNAALTFQLRSPSPRRSVIGGALLLDVGLLTGVLYLVGGPLNPFSIVYLVGITMGAVALGHRWAVTLAIVSNLAYGLTFRYNRPFEFIDPALGGGILALHLYGMWVALAAAAVLRREGVHARVVNMPTLKPLEALGLVQWNDRDLRLSRCALPYARVVASAFDAYRQGGSSRFSNAI